MSTPASRPLRGYEAIPRGDRPAPPAAPASGATRPSSPAAPALSGDPEYRGRHRSRLPDTGELPETPPGAPGQDDDEDELHGLSSYVVSHLRTVVPLAWGAAVTWAIDRYVPWVPPTVATDPMILSVVTSVLTACWYALWRAAEPFIPALLVTVLLGHPAEPAYSD